MYANIYLVKCYNLPYITEIYTSIRNYDANSQQTPHTKKNVILAVCYL